MVTFRQSCLSRAAALVLAAGLASLAHAQTVGTSFTYQGELANAGSPVTGTFDVQFRLYTAATDGSQIGATLCSDDLAIVNGRFVSILDFGPVFTGGAQYLEIAVREDTGLGCSDSSGFTTLLPRQELTAAPNASFATTAANAMGLNGQAASYYQNAANLTGTLPGSSLSGVYTNALTLNNPANIFTGNGAGLTNLNATNLFGTIDAARMPSNWMAGGDLSGFLPNPSIRADAVTLDKLSPGARSVLTNMTSLVPDTTPIDPVGWGWNGDGQTNVPALPAGVTYAAMAAGVVHSVALRSDGTVIAWGYDGLGLTSVPALPAGVTYVAVEAGALHSIALRSDGTAVAWGSNDDGQLNVLPLPAGVVYSAVSGGAAHSLALRSDGAVVAWGRNDLGQTNVPTLPAGVTYTAVAGGRNHSVALRSDGTVDAWGSNAELQVNVPSLPAGMTYTAVAAGGYHSMALRSDGNVVVWGNGVDVQTTVPPLPVGVRYTAVAAGELHSVALRSDGAVIAWGRGSSGQTAVPALPMGAIYTAVAAGGEHSLALRQSTPAPSVSTSVGMSIGSATPPPATGGLSVAGASSFAAGVTAASFTGNGAGLTNLNPASLSGPLAEAQIPSLSASKIATGTLAVAQIPNLDASKITTGTLAAAQIPNLDASKITAGTLAVAQIPNLDASKITTGTLAAAQIPNLNASKITTGTLAVAQIPNLDASKITTGFLAAARLPTGGIWALTSNLNIDSNTLVIDQLNARVGIGTATPAYTLDVAGSAQLAGAGRLQFNGRGHIQTTELLYLNPFTGGGNVIVGGGGGAGNMQVIGSLAKGGGSFKIDHPLDPENKYLYHSFVESPDMMNVYNGNITTDSDGYATITMPDYFEALNRDFRYQLTVVDPTTFAMVRVSREITGNSFEIASNVPNTKVSWQVTGIRHDAWANKNRIPNTVDKPASEKGKLLHPEAFNQPVEKGVHFAVPAAASNQ